MLDLSRSNIILTILALPLHSCSKWSSSFRVVPLLIATFQPKKHPDVWDDSARKALDPALAKLIQRFRRTMNTLDLTPLDEQQPALVLSVEVDAIREPFPEGIQWEDNLARKLQICQWTMMVTGRRSMTVGRSNLNIGFLGCSQPSPLPRCCSERPREMGCWRRRKHHG